MTSSKPSISYRSSADWRLARGLLLPALAAFGLVLLIGLFLLREALPAWREIGILRFVTDSAWYPLQGAFGLLPMLVASLLSSAGAVLLATLFGLASAAFTLYFAPAWLASWQRTVTGLLAGIPSVVYGFWGLTTLAPLLARWQPPGVGLLCATLILAAMILPTVALTSEAALKALPRDYQLTAQALGLSRWTTLRGVLLPAARRGILAGVLLAAGRALGETMAVLMVAGNVVQWPGGWFDSVRTLTANIALEMAYAMGTHKSALFVSGLMLLLPVAILAGLARRLIGSQHG